MDVFLAIAFICILKGSFGDFYVNVTQTACVSFNLNKDLTSQAVIINKNRQGVLQTIENNETFHAFGSFSGRITIYNITRPQGTLSFCIVNTTTFDGGDYYYSPSNTDRISETLYVLDKPSTPFIIVIQNGTIESENGKVSCMSRSTSAPQGLQLTYSWFVNNTSIKIGGKYKCNGSSTCNELIIAVDRNDAFNEYKCLATEQYGKTSEFSDIVNVDPKRRPRVTLRPSGDTYKIVIYQELTIHCIVVDAYPSVTLFTWRKKIKKFLISEHTGQIFTVGNVTQNDSATYECIASNGLSNGTADIFVDVLYGVEIITINKQVPIEGTQLIVTCSGQSNPAVTNNDVAWTKQDNKTLSMKGKQLVIYNVNKSDRGIYICSVVIQLTPTVGQPLNVIGRTTVEVDVLYRPNVAIAPNFVQYSVIENTTNLELVCRVVDANPSVTSYRWYKAGFLINYPINATYTISTVQRSDTGPYTCDATNIVNSSEPSSAEQLNVLYGIGLYPFSKINQTEGNTLTTTCSGQSNPMMTNNNVKWFKQNNNTFSREGLQLVIDNVNRLDSGTYVCSAVIQLTPTVGQPVNVTGTTNVQVEVLFRPTVTVVPDNKTYNVNENSTNVHLTCKVTDANPVVTSYRWYKDGVMVPTADHETYTLSTVDRSHTGNYMCDAKNDIGNSDLSSALQLNVLYGVSLKISEAEISINESERWELLCIGDGNPLPKIICVYIYNSTIVGEQEANVTLLSVDHANCLDTGIYMCSGNNAIGKPVSQSAYIKVGCKPRMYNTLEKQNIFIDGADESLNISATFISFPLSDIVWSRQLPCGNFTDLGSEFITSTSPSQLPYETISNLQKDQLKPDEFGIYLVKASNIHGSFHLKYHVIPKRAPDPPTNITASCGVTSIRVIWITGFNGGENQTFRIKFADTKANQTIFKDDIAEGRDDKIINVVKESVSPDTLYRIVLEAYNLYGTTKSTEITNCTTLKNQEENQRLTSTLIGGIAGSISALLIVVIVIGGLYCRRRRKFTGGKIELNESESNETDEDEDGLKDNPLYVTSGEVSNADEGPMYGVVNKTKQYKENVDSDDKKNEGPVYAEVQKSSTHGKKKQKKKRTKDTSKKENNTAIELGTIYENSDKLFKHTDSEELYANAGEQDDGITLPVAYTPKKNKDGLVYADVDLLPGPSGNRFVIRGQENRTNYAIIDLSKKAELLTSDTEDEDKDSTNVN